MPAKKIGKRTIWVKRRVRRDRLDDSPAAASPVHEVKGCAILPRLASGTQGNEQDKGWTVAEGHQIFCPFKSDVLADDQVSVDGPDGPWWEVDGMPADYENRRAKGKATMIFLKKVGT